MSHVQHERPSASNLNLRTTKIDGNYFPKLNKIESFCSLVSIDGQALKFFQIPNAESDQSFQQLVAKAKRTKIIRDGSFRQLNEKAPPYLIWENDRDIFQP